ncbi:monocarboxylate transporter 7 isoform X2 [Octopus sinensis]|uniref:Monocarboxylate transporter 7 isoform X2 n=1 Tax=Octopus sinensis TaxID=2607531 RepID=A0A6P7TCN5_9MOLL|nr:monocarboxylate transporter 7 isoform X2 [Octopus sinensis]
MGKNSKKNQNLSKPPVEIQHDDYVDAFIPTPPDGGWGWVIVFASLLSNVIVDGVAYSFGVFLDEFVTYFNESRSKTSLIGSVLAGTYLCAGPIVSAFTNRFGCRPVAVVGSFIGAFAFLLSTLSPNIDTMIIFYGGFGGFGLGLIYLPSIVSVGYYFDRRRAIATGIAVCGSGVGTFIFAPLGGYLLEQYDWKNSLYIIAGLILNGAVCAMLMRPLEVPRKKGLKKKVPPREKNMIDRIKEQTKRTRLDSEPSIVDDVKAIDATNSLFQKVQLAKLQREDQLNEDESELGSLPSTIFLKRQDSEQTRPKKLSLSDRGDTFSKSSTPTDLPKIVVHDPVSSKSPSPDSDTSVTNESAQNPQENTANSTRSLKKQDSETTNSTKSHSKRKSLQKRRESDEVSVTPSISTPVTPVTPEDCVINPEQFTDVNSSSHSKHHSTSNRLVVASLPNGLQTDTKDPSRPLLGDVHKNLVVKQNRDGTKEYWHRSSEFAVRSNKELIIPKEDYARPLYRKDIFYSGSIVHIPQFQSQPDMTSYITSITTIPGMIPAEKTSLFWDFICIPKTAKDTLREMLDFSLLIDPAFGIICLGNILVFLGYFIPFVFLRDRATVELNIKPSNAAFLLSIIGITNTIGRVVTGFLADLRKVDSLLINNIALLVTGIATCLSLFCNNYATLCIYASVFGLFAAAFISLTSIIICDLLGLDKLTNAFGLLSLVRGISTIIGPPLAGAIYDSTKKYDSAFQMGGILIICGGLLHFILYIPPIAKRRHRIQREIITSPNEAVIDEKIEEELSDEEIEEVKSC